MNNKLLFFKQDNVDLIERMNQFEVRLTGKINEVEQSIHVVALLQIITIIASVYFIIKYML